MDDFWEGFMAGSAMSAYNTKSHHADDYESCVSDYEEEQLYKEIYGDDDDEDYESDDFDCDEDDSNDYSYFSTPIFAPAPPPEKSCFEQAVAAAENSLYYLNCEKQEAERLEKEKKEKAENEIKELKEEKRKAERRLSDNKSRVKGWSVLEGIFVLCLIKSICGKSGFMLALSLFCAVLALCIICDAQNEVNNAKEEIPMIDAKIYQKKQEYDNLLGEKI